MSRSSEILDKYNVREAHAADAQESAFVHFIAWKSTYRGIIAQPYLDSLALADRLTLRRKILSANEGVHLVATFENKIIGFYDADHFRFHANQRVSEDQLKKRNEKGEVWALYILKEHQHKGVGKALFHIGKEKLKERALTPFIAWVLKENHQAILFYEKMGGKCVDEVEVVIGGMPYLEIAYRFSESS